jgi:outer membrane protein OmpA-like peptidoglycan-associated protein
VAGPDATAAFAERMNAFQAQAPGRDALAGLDAIASPAGSPVWVFSPLLDTRGSLDMNQLAFDQSPPDVVTAVQAAGDLPDLTGREVNFVVTPVAGEQNPLSDVQVGYQHAIWEGVATAAGAANVTFYDGTGTGAGTGTIPVVATPDPTDKISSEGSGPTRTCTLPTPALFLPNEATLIDKEATLTALGECVGTVDPSTKITVEGHTAAVPGGDPQGAIDLSTQRATEVAALLQEVGVAPENITSVVGLGDSAPLVEPASDPGNRAVVVTFTSAG